MFLVFLIKNICLMSFYFAFSTVVFTSLIHRPMLIVYFITLGCFSLSYFIQNNMKHTKFKYLAMLGLVLITLYLRNVIGIIVSIPPFIYMLFIIKKDKYEVYYNEFKSLFMSLIVAILALPIFVYIVGNLEIFKSYSLPYALVFVVSGYYLLRTVRHSEKVINSRKFIIMNLIVIIASFTICIILGSETVLKSLINLFDIVFRKGLFLLIKKAFNMIFNSNTTKLIMDDDKVGMEEKLIKIEEEILPEIEDAQFDYLQFSYILYPFAIAMIIFVIIAIIAKITSKRKRIQDNDAEVYGIKQYRSSLDDDISVDNKTKRILSGSVEQIRHWYRKFLLLCFKRNMDIFIYDNSKSICEKSSKIFVNLEQELVDMKEIYRKARYSEETVDKQDIKSIKNICKNLEKKKHQKM